MIRHGTVMVQYCIYMVRCGTVLQMVWYSTYGVIVRYSVVRYGRFPAKFLVGVRAFFCFCFFCCSHEMIKNDAGCSVVFSWSTLVRGVTRKMSLLCLCLVQADVRYRNFAARIVWVIFVGGTSLVSRFCFLLESKSHFCCVRTYSLLRLATMVGALWGRWE